MGAKTRVGWVDVAGGQVVDWTRSSNEGSGTAGIQRFNESAALQACVEQASAALALGVRAASQVQSQRRLLVLSPGRDCVSVTI